MQHPTQLGKYLAHEQLGRGGFGAVYRAVDQKLGREVALKVLHPQLTVDPAFLERFRQEARLLANLPHTNIVYILDLDEQEGRSFIVMEYLPGGSLHERIQKGSIAFEPAMKILEQVCHGLQAIHDRGLVHRDIKPGNILFNASGEAVLSDFGLARAVQLSGASVSSLAGGMGTPFYRAPELWRGKPPASPASDVYSLAAVFYEMLTGKILFAGDTPDEVLTKHLVDGPEFSPGWLPLGAPPGLEDALNKALARDPAQRFNSTVSFVQALGLQFEVQPLAVLPAPSPISDNPAGIEWVDIPAGDFLHGEGRRKAHIRKPYQIGKYPVTVAQFAAFVQATNYEALWE